MSLLVLLDVFFLPRLLIRHTDSDLVSPATFNFHCPHFYNKVHLYPHVAIKLCHPFSLKPSVMSEAC